MFVGLRCKRYQIDILVLYVCVIVRPVCHTAFVLGSLDLEKSISLV